MDNTKMGVKRYVEYGLASIVTGCSLHPLDLIKVRMQLQGAAPNPALRPAFAFQTPAAASRLGPVSVGVRIVKQQGVSALFSGVSATVLRQCLYSTTRMGITEIIMRNRSDPDKNRVSLTRILVAVLVPCAVGAAIGNPADVAMVRMQADGRLPLAERRNYKSVVDAIYQMSKNEGVTSLWRGSFLTVNCATLVYASQIASYIMFKRTIIEKGIMKNKLGTHVTASFASGFVAAVVSNPVDVIKTRIMNMKVERGMAPPYKGAIDCAMKTIKAEGPMALYKGFIPTVLRQGSVLLVMSVTREQIHKLFMNAPSVTFSFSLSVDK